MRKYFIFVVMIYANFLSGCLDEQKLKVQTYGDCSISCMNICEAVLSIEMPVSDVTSMIRELFVSELKISNVKVKSDRLYGEINVFSEGVCCDYYVFPGKTNQTCILSRTFKGQDENGAELILESTTRYLCNEISHKLDVSKKWISVKGNN